MTTCEYDTGSLYDCRPACDRPATVTVEYRNGSYGPFRTGLCASHVGPMRGRVFPSALTFVIDTALVSA